MMSLRSFNNVSIQNYPRIQIDRGKVIKPCVADQTAADQFIDKPANSWRKIIHDIWHEGIPYILRWISNIKVPTNSNTYYTYLIKIIKYFAILILHIHQVYLYIYGYFYPYSLMSYDEVCDQFSRTPKWTEAIIRAFAWHPNHDRCALAICNDYIYVYDGPVRTRVLRHNHQRKIVDLIWQPTNKETLIVATQTSIIIWRVPDDHGGPLSLRDNSRGSNLTYLAPTSHLLFKGGKESTANGNTKEDSLLNNTITTNTLNQTTSQTCQKNFKLIEDLIAPPIVSIQFDQSGEKLYICSPNSSKIVILDINNLFNSIESNPDNNIKYLRRFGQGITKLVWSPDKGRLAAATTSSFVRVFEPFKWSCNKWTTQGIIQDMVWSKPTGRVLLIALKNEPAIYALPFLDKPQAKDVGGNKSLMKALDLSPTTRAESDDFIGGRIQSFAWDKEGKRLAISFKDNPESILIYRTVETPTIEFHQIGVIQSDNKSTPLLMDFHDNFKNGSLLTICWDDGSCQHVPFNYTSKQPNSFNESYNSSPKSPRSLTNFFHVSQPTARIARLANNKQNPAGL